MQETDSTHLKKQGLWCRTVINLIHYSDAIIGAMASQITSLTIVYSTVYSDADQRKHQSSASLAFVRGIHRLPVNCPHKGPETRKMFPFDDVIMSKCLTLEGLVYILTPYRVDHWFLWSVTLTTDLLLWWSIKNRLSVWKKHVGNHKVHVSRCNIIGT